MSTHTPGPWTVLPEIPTNGGISIGPVIEGIGPHAEVCFNGGPAEANARLIAAAPDLLAALEGLVDVCAGRADNPNTGFDISLDNAVKAGVTAIAKATGIAPDEPADPDAGAASFSERQEQDAKRAKEAGRP